ncbi:alkaline phosphatase family protein [Saccharopolyspora taberi]|uniref:Alkaline phosphatase family protein n=1 Tax=Saccharopolyspora taberi TaxID=60895 RepID=A0ABN3VDN8_9PSEU
MDWIVAPDHDGRALPDVLPSLLAAMGVPGFAGTAGFPACRNAAVLLVDGLGWNLLHEHADDAPFLVSLAAGPVPVGFPTTTATSITSLGTGRCSGEHGVVGYTFAEPSGALLHPLSWGTRGETDRRSLLEAWPPEQAQPRPTVLERAAEAGVDVRIAVPAEFRGTGLTRAALRGADFRGVRALGDLAAELLSALAGPGPGLCYGYHGHLDLLGHVHGPGSLPWRMQLRQINALVENLAQQLPKSSVLAVVADHGMVGVDPATALDIDAEPALQDGVRLIGGEARARHVYAEPGAEAAVLAAWREAVGDRGAVVTAEQAIAAGWFGPVVSPAVRPRIGDVIAVMRTSAIIRSAAEPGESALRGQHGSLTADEQYVPLLVARG